MTLGRFGLRRRQYEFPPYRPPSEADSLLLRVTRGCPWNRCTFCSMYKTERFQIRPIEAILQDIETAKDLYPDRVKTVFLGDSNSLVVPKEKLVRILHALHAAFPRIARVTSYARAKTLLKKTGTDLLEIRQAGLTRLHVGLETGDPELLREIEKGATPEEMVAGGIKAKQAGYEYSLYVLLGIGGEDRWRQHARGSAEVLNRIDPHFIRVRTFIPQPGSVLYEAVREGRFTLPSPEAVLRETRLLLENLDGTSEFLSDHISNLIPLYGTLPEAKGEMIQTLTEALDRLKRDEGWREALALQRYLTHL